MSPTDGSKGDPESITAAINRVYGEGQNEPDPAILAVGVETLKRVEWDEPTPESNSSSASDGTGAGQQR